MNYNVFDRKGRINQSFNIKVPAKKEPKLPELTSDAKKWLEYGLNAHLFIAYAAMRECVNLVEKCNSSFNKKEMLYPQVIDFITKCCDTKDYFQIIMNDYMERCKTPDGEERVAKLLMFAYDAASSHITYIRDNIYKTMADKFGRKKKRAELLSYVVTAQLLIFMSYDLCTHIERHFKSVIPFINEFTHFIDISNAVVAIDLSLTFALDGKEASYKTDSFNTDKRLLSAFFLDETLYQRCCKNLDYIP